MDIDTCKVNAKGRRAFTDTKGRTYEADTRREQTW